MILWFFGLQERRTSCTLNHTATHLLNHSLRSIDEFSDTEQAGSSVGPHQLTFSFSCKVSQSHYQEQPGYMYLMIYVLINVLFVIEIIMIMDKKHSQNYGLCFNRTSITPYYEEIIVIHITVIQSSIRISMRHNV